MKEINDISDTHSTALGMKYLKKYPVSNLILPCSDSSRICRDLAVFSHLVQSFWGGLHFSLASGIGSFKGRNCVDNCIWCHWAYSRYAYTHGITPRASDILPASQSGDNGLTLKKRELRISLTFRKILGGVPCACKFPAFCDSQKDKKILLDDSLAQALEDTHVHEVYEQIADHFSETRHKAWPRVEEFVSGIGEDRAQVLVDVGCGNGKYLGRNPGQVQVQI